MVQGEAGCRSFVASRGGVERKQRASFHRLFTKMSLMQAAKDGEPKLGSSEISVSVAANTPKAFTAPAIAPEPFSPSKRFNIGDAVQGGPNFSDSSPPPDSAERIEAKQQICFDYTKGVCKRGTACKYSHDVEEIVRVNSQERGVCFDFLRNSCQRGLLCRFSHDLSSIVIQGQQGQKLGRKNAPICYDFVKGVCKREDCRYSHDIFSVIRGKNSNTGPEICYDFTRGKCKRGSACRYSHDILDADSLPAMTPDAVAALAAQHAQLAAATAVAVEASRRQSAPGCLQAAASDPLFGWLGSLPGGPLAPGLGEAAAASQSALAFQLQSQFLMQVQAQAAAAANLLQTQMAQGMPTHPWEAEAVGPQMWSQQNLMASLLAQNLASSALQLPGAAPFPAAGLQNPRRHTYDGNAAHGLPSNPLVQPLEQMSLSAAMQAEIQEKRESGKMLASLGPRDSYTGEPKIGADWQPGSNASAPMWQQPSLALKQQLHASLALSQSSVGSTAAQSHPYLDLDRSGPLGVADALAGGAATTAGENAAGLHNQVLGQTPRILHTLRPSHSNPVPRQRQDVVNDVHHAATSTSSWQARTESELPVRPGSVPHIGPELQVNTSEPITSISFEARPQAVAREQLAFFQEIWKQ